jgi:thiosulfate dehydrogenase [quinone] large subunit
MHVSVFRFAQIYILDGPKNEFSWPIRENQYAARKAGEFGEDPHRVFRLTIGWTFLYAGIHHFGDDKFVIGFLSRVKTFHDVYEPLTNPAIAPVLTFFVEYGHLLIGLSLISGLLVRVSAPFAIMLLLMYWTAHMDFPYIENVNNYLIDYHIVYAGVLVYLMVKRAGHVFGLDGGTWRNTIRRCGR